MLRSDEGGANGVMVHGGDGATREMKGDTEGGATGDTEGGATGDTEGGATGDMEDGGTGDTGGPGATRA